MYSRLEHFTYDGITLAGGTQYGDTHIHKDDNHHLYVQVDADTLIVDGNIIVEGYIAGNGALGITMEDPAAEADIPTITGNDQDNFIGTAVYNKDPEDDFVSDANAVDDGGHPGDLLRSLYILLRTSQMMRAIKINR